MTAPLIRLGPPPRPPGPSLLLLLSLGTNLTLLPEGYAPGPDPGAHHNEYGTEDDRTGNDPTERRPMRV